jgi:hypothetical protein
MTISYDKAGQQLDLAATGARDGTLYTSHRRRYVSCGIGCRASSDSPQTLPNRATSAGTREHLGAAKGSEQTRETPQISALQSRLHRFDSGRRLEKCLQIVAFCETRLADIVYSPQTLPKSRLHRSTFRLLGRFAGVLPSC